MSTTRIRNLAVALGLLLLGGLAVAVWAFVDRAPAPAVTLYARDMAFYRAADATPNPTLRVPAGGRLEVTLVNDQAGMRHDLAVAALGFALGPLDATPGSRATAILVAPAQPGRYAYVCALHSQMMRGVLEVTPAAER